MFPPSTQGGFGEREAPVSALRLIEVVYPTHYLT